MCAVDVIIWGHERQHLYLKWGTIPGFSKRFRGLRRGHVGRTSPLHPFNGKKSRNVSEFQWVTAWGKMPQRRNDRRGMLGRSATGFSRCGFRLRRATAGWRVRAWGRMPEVGKPWCICSAQRLRIPCIGNHEEREGSRPIPSCVSSCPWCFLVHLRVLRVLRVPSWLPSPQSPYFFRLFRSVLRSIPRIRAASS
jgi:hypothetical protein